MFIILAEMNCHNRYVLIQIYTHLGKIFSTTKLMRHYETYFIASLDLYGFKKYLKTLIVLPFQMGLISQPNIQIALRCPIVSSWGVLALPQNTKSLVLSNFWYIGISYDRFFYVKMMYIQLRTNAIVRLLNKPYGNEVTLRGQKPPLKCCQSLEQLMYIRRGGVIFPYR